MTQPAEQTRYNTGLAKWTHGEVIEYVNGRTPNRWLLGPCPKCGSVTHNYGSAYSCTNDLCSNSASQFACGPAPAPTWWNTGINVMLDGEAWFATGPGFINLQESPAGFGDTPNEAVEEYRKHTAPAAPGGEQKCPPCVNSGVCQTLGRCMYEEPSPPAGGGDAANGYCPKCGGDTLQRAGGNTDWCRCTPPPAATPGDPGLFKGSSTPRTDAVEHKLNSTPRGKDEVLFCTEDEYDEMVEHARELERESAGLREDKERLDFLEGTDPERVPEVNLKWSGEGAFIWAVGIGGEEYLGSTLREAIDQSALAGGEEGKDV